MIQNLTPVEQTVVPKLDEASVKALADLEAFKAETKEPAPEINPKSTQHRFPVELVKIFKTLGMHAPVGIRPPGAAVHRAKMNMRRKAARGR